MIVKMKKTTLICLSKDKEQALEKLRELGVMQISDEIVNDSSEREELELAIANSERAIACLSSRDNPVQSEKFVDLKGEDICGLVIDAEDEQANINKKLESLLREREQLIPWGDFSSELIQTLKNKGVYVYLCHGGEDDMNNPPEGAEIKVLHQEKGSFYYVMVSDVELDEEKLPLATLPKGVTLKDIEREMADCNRAFTENEKQLDNLVSAKGILNEYYEQLKDKLAFVSTRDSMTDNENLSYVSGFIPVTEEEKLKEGAMSNGWALKIEDPGPDDRVPTYIKIPKIFQMVRPVFDFLGISPGYDEVDVSVCFLFFFSIFFGMILGDAGYGTIFLIASIILRFKVKGDKAIQAVNLLTVLSLVTILWGGLTGNWFGVSAPGVKALTDPETKNACVQLICFSLAVVHLSIGRIWRAILFGASKAALGEIGWAVVIWGNFLLTIRLLVFPGDFPEIMYWFYGIGLFLAIFSVNWKDVGDIFNFPFGLIGSFVDVLSYIRLFAVGMAGYYIAASFNDMGMGLIDINIYAGIAGILVILAGHMLNVVLCLMGVLVHGVRLNTLEFSNHMNLQWSGVEFVPFRKLTDK